MLYLRRLMYELRDERSLDIAIQYVPILCWHKITVLQKIVAKHLPMIELR